MQKALKMWRLYCISANWGTVATPGHQSPCNFCLCLIATKVLSRTISEMWWHIVKYSHLWQSETLFRHRVQAEALNLQWCILAAKTWMHCTVTLYLELFDMVHNRDRNAHSHAEITKKCRVMRNVWMLFGEKSRVRYFHQCAKQLVVDCWQLAMNDM